MADGRSIVRLLAAVLMVLSCASCGLLAEPVRFRVLPEAGCASMLADGALRGAMQTVFADWPMVPRFQDSAANDEFYRQCWGAVSAADGSDLTRTPPLREVNLRMDLSQEDRSPWSTEHGVAEARRLYRDLQPVLCPDGAQTHESPIGAIGDETSSCWKSLPESQQYLVSFRESNVRVYVTIEGADATAGGIDIGSAGLRAELQQNTWCVAEALGSRLGVTVRSHHSCWGALAA